MTRESAIQRAVADFDEGNFLADLRRRVAIPTESQNPERLPDLYRYLEEEMRSGFESMGYVCRVFDNPFDGQGPVLLAERTGPHPGGKGPRVEHVRDTRIPHR